MPLNYIGSKHSLLEFIDDVFRKTADGDEKIFCDIFAGTGAVGRHFKRKGMFVLANDIQYYSYVLNRAYIGVNHPPAFSGVLDRYGDEIRPSTGLFADPAGSVLEFLNSVPGRRGFIASNYSPESGRLFYTSENAMRIDAVRMLLEEWRANDVVTDDEYYYVLCCLIEAADKIANTASVYGAFLKKFKASALRPLTLRPIQLTNSVPPGIVYNEDANGLVRQIESDVLYIDPPYNHRQYGANYHVLETIAKYDDPSVKGITGLRPYYRSPYCQQNNVCNAFRDLVLNAKTRHILVSYNDEGLAHVNEILEVLALRGNPVTFSTPYARYKADNGRDYKREGTVEYVHYVRIVK